MLDATEKLVLANHRIMELERRLALFNSGGFADADALAAKYLSVREDTARRCIEIAHEHAAEWVKPSEGASPVPVGSHACFLVADAIGKEYGITKPEEQTK